MICRFSRNIFLDGQLSVGHQGMIKMRDAKSTDLSGSAKITQVVEMVEQLNKQSNCRNFTCDR